jgi:hypothetical protein
VTKSTETRITKFKDIIEERFRACSDRSAPSTATMYYRGSINFDDHNIWHDHEDIKSAYKRVLPKADEPKIAFVAYNKNAQLTFVPPVQSPIPSRDKFKIAATPEMVFGTETNGPQKHAYYVLENGAGLTKEELSELVSASSNILAPLKQINPG